MPRTIAIAGPHSIGKSTTAKELADILKLGYMPSFAGELAKVMSYDINNNPSAEETLRYQKEVVWGFKYRLEVTKTLDVIYDRSPLDAAAYTVLQVGLYISSSKEVSELVQECLKATNKFVDVLIIPEADFSAPYDAKLGRPTCTPEQAQYRQRFFDLINEYAAVLRDTKVIRVPADKQYEDRVKFIVGELALV